MKEGFCRKVMWQIGFMRPGNKNHASLWLISRWLTPGGVESHWVSVLQFSESLFSHQLLFLPGSQDFELLGKRDLTVSPSCLKVTNKLVPAPNRSEWQRSSFFTTILFVFYDFVTCKTKGNWGFITWSTLIDFLASWRLINFFCVPYDGVVGFLKAVKRQLYHSLWEIQGWLLSGR